MVFELLKLAQFRIWNFWEYFVDFIVNMKSELHIPVIWLIFVLVSWYKNW